MIGISLGLLLLQNVAALLLVKVLLPGLLVIP